MDAPEPPHSRPTYASATATAASSSSSSPPSSVATASAPPPATASETCAPAAPTKPATAEPSRPDRSRMLDSDFRYIDRNGNVMKSRTELTISQMLDFLGIKYEYGHTVHLGDGTAVQVDFKTDKGLIEAIDGDGDIAKYKRMRSDASLSAEHIMAVGGAKHVARTGEMDKMVYYDKAPQTGSIFLEDDSFSFDYAHILPLVEKCSILHGHTSSVMVELAGQMKDNMLVDFGLAKGIVRGVVSEFDHKFFINERYVAGQDGSHYTIRFDGPRGTFNLQMPKDTTYLLKGEATVENLATEIIRLLAPRMPPNVEAVGVYIYEGYNKGSHIITKIRDIAE